MFKFSALHGATMYALFILLFLLLSLVAIGCNNKTETQGESQPRLAASANHTISLDDAIKLTRNFRSSIPPDSVRAESFSVDAIRNLINQKDCAGVRIYYGKKDDGKPALVLVGTDSTGEDMTAGLIIETGWPCPPICPQNSPLNK